jgi:hypothetical protein
MDTPELGGVHPDSGRPGKIFLYFPDELARRAAIKFPQQFQVQGIFGQLGEQLEFCIHKRSLRLLGPIMGEAMGRVG